VAVATEAMHLADGRTFPATARGNVHLRIPGCSQPYVLHHVLYVPQNKENLLSVAQLTEVGCNSRQLQGHKNFGQKGE